MVPTLDGSTSDGSAPQPYTKARPATCQRLNPMIGFPPQLPARVRRFFIDPLAGFTPFFLSLIPRIFICQSVFLLSFSLGLGGFSSTDLSVFLLSFPTGLGGFSSTPKAGFSSLPSLYRKEVFFNHLPHVSDNCLSLRSPTPVSRLPKHLSPPTRSTELAS